MGRTYEEMQLINQLRQAEIPYDDSRDGVVIVRFSGDNIDDINCYISVNKLESGLVSATVNFFDFFSFSSNLNGYVACNKANEDSLVAKFYIDNEGDAVGEFTGLYRNGFDTEHFVSLLENFALDMDDAYPFFEEAL